MNRLVRGSVLIAAAVGAWACGGDPFAENLDSITEISATPEAVFVSNTDSQAVVVEALNNLGQQVGVEFTRSNVTAGIVVNRDTGFAQVIEGPNLDSRARFFVKGADSTTFTTGSFVVTAGGVSTTVEVSVVPATTAGSIPIIFSNATPALGDTITLTLPANVRITDSSSLSFADPTLAAVIAGASADSNTIFVLVGPGVTDQAVTVNNVAISYLPGQFFDLQTTANVTTPAVTSAAVTFSTTTPAGGAQVTMTAPPGFQFVDDTAQIVVDFGGSLAWIDSISADLSTVYFVPPPSATGAPLIDGLALDFLPDVALTLLPATTALTVGPTQFPGSDNVATAPVLPVPASGSSITFYDGGTYGSGVVGGNSQVYQFTVAANTTLDLTLDWNSDADVDVLWTDNPVTAFICTGGATGNHPEVDTCSFTPGSYVLVVDLFAGTAPGVMKFDLSTQ